MSKHERPEPENESDRRFMAMIDEFGWTVLRIADTKGEKPRFQYSAGIFEHCGQPELLIVGLPPDVGGRLVNDYGRRVSSGERVESGSRQSEFLNGFDVVFVETDCKVASKEYTCWTDWYYRRNRFPLLQLVWPDKSGLFPWEPGCDENFQHLQPVLSKPQSLAT